MSSATLPDSCGVAFKEWAGVCEALSEGRQALILRKGGIAEGPRGFVPEHRAFWLYPTHVHEAEQGLRSPRTRISADPPPETVAVQALALVETIDRVERVDLPKALEDLHVWTDETVRKRFHYRQPGLWVLGVRVFRLDRAIPIAVTPEHVGCKTWVPLEPPLSTAGLVPVLDPAAFSRVLDRVRTAMAADPSAARGT